ncbi:MAG: DUF4249 domain-containing protein [Bacteroidota bacterium]
MKHFDLRFTKYDLRIERNCYDHFKIKFSNVIVLLYILLFVSCEKDITVDLPQPESKVVVDGYVETGKPIYILLSRNAPYFAPVNSSTLNTGEKGAIVTVNDGTQTVTLTELPLTINGVTINGLYIALNLSSLDTTMKGEEGKTYTLNITTSGGEQLSAVTKLNPAIPLDSVWFQIQESLPGNDSLGYVWATLKDPDTLNNCYRWMAMRAGKDSSFLPPFGSTFEDKFVNATRFDFAFPRGSVLNSSADDDNNDEAGFFKKGDSVIVKFCVVDRSTFEFWRDAETQVGNNGSPFTTPAPIRSNVVGGLGLFAAYSPWYYSFLAQ